jgi:signal transduction histidine kinase
MEDKLKDLNILLVDDDDTIRKSMDFFFRKKTKYFLGVETAELAMNQVKNFDWDVIICDYKLPGINGMDFFRKIAPIKPRSLKIMITAYPSTDVAIDGIRMGIHDFIQKPFTAKDIMESIYRLTKKEPDEFLEKQASFAPASISEKYKSNEDFLIHKVSHQINNSLQALYGALHLSMLKNDTDWKNSVKMDIIFNNLKRIEDLNNELSRLGDNRKEPFQKTDVDKIIEKCLYNYDEMIQKSGIVIEKHENPQGKVRIQTKPKSLLHILDNIILNAIQAMEKNSGKEKILEVYAKQSEKKLSIHIADTGPGIDNALMEKIKLKHFTTKSRGTGLGLYIVDKLCEEIDGGWKIRNRERGGTHVQVWLPRNVPIVQNNQQSITRLPEEENI